MAEFFNAVVKASDGTALLAGGYRDMQTMLYIARTSCYNYRDDALEYAIWPARKWMGGRNWLQATVNNVPERYWRPVPFDVVRPD
jgi:hypothetical protein